MLGNFLYTFHLDSLPDANNDACGAFIVSCDNIVSHKMWSSEERIMSSTWRELKAIYYSLLSFLPLLKGQNVHWFSENQVLYLSPSLVAGSLICRNWHQMFSHCVLITIFQFILSGFQEISMR